jgi:hypothetical protein
MEFEWRGINLYITIIEGVHGFIIHNFWVPSPEKFENYWSKVSRKTDFIRRNVPWNVSEIDS